MDLTGPLEDRMKRGLRTYLNRELSTDSERACGRSAPHAGSPREEMTGVDPASWRDGAENRVLLHRGSEIPLIDMLAAHGGIITTTSSANARTTARQAGNHNGLGSGLLAVLEGRR